MTTPPARLPLCADASRAAGEDPVGTAPHWQEVTVLELDVPMWAALRNVETWTDEQRGVFEALRGKVEASGAGFGLLMAAPERSGGHCGSATTCGGRAASPGATTGPTCLSASGRGD